jgi:hypothetical protein
MEDAPYPLAPIAAPLAFLVLLRGVLLGAATGGVRLLGWCRSDRRGCAPRAGVAARGFRACLGARGAPLYSLLVPPTRTASRTPLERTQRAFQRPDWVRSPENASRAGLRGHSPLVCRASKGAGRTRVAYPLQLRDGEESPPISLRRRTPPCAAAHLLARPHGSYRARRHTEMCGAGSVTRPCGAGRPQGTTRGTRDRPARGPAHPFPMPHSSCSACAATEVGVRPGQGSRLRRVSRRYRGGRGRGRCGGPCASSARPGLGP